MKNIKRSATISLGLIAATALTGCTSLETTPERDIVNDERGKAIEIIKKGSNLSERPSSVSFTDEIWVGGGKLEITERDRLPTFFSEEIVFSEQSPTLFTSMISQVSSSIGKKIKISTDAMDHLAGFSRDSENSEPEGDVIQGDPMDVGDFEGSSSASSSLVGDMLLTVDFDGSVLSLLDDVTSRVGLYWRWDGSSIEIFRSESKTFIIDLIAAENEFEASVSSTSEGDSEDGGSSSLSSHKTTVKSSPDGSLQSIEDAVFAMLSKSGLMSLSKSTGLLTITDTPEVIKKVGKMVKNINSILSKQVAIKTEIYDISISSEDSNGVDWNILYNGSSKIGLGLATAGAGVGSAENLIRMGIVNSGSKFFESESFLKAMSGIAEVSLVTSSYSYALNGQPVPIQVVEEIGYLKEISVETTDGATSTSLTPGITTSGLSMVVTPRITSKNNVMVQVAMDLSTLDEIKEFGPEDTRIQLPQRSVKNFLQKSILKNGKTLMISGFERTEGRYKSEGPFGSESWKLAGSRDKSKKKVMTVILMTTHIMAD